MGEALSTLSSVIKGQVSVILILSLSLSICAMVAAVSIIPVNMLINFTKFVEYKIKQ